MLTSVDPELMGRDITVAEVLDQAALTVASDLAGQPEVEATVRTNLGRTYHSLGRYENADLQLAAAVELTRSVYGVPHAETAAAFTHLGILRHDQGQLDEADELYGKAMGTYEDLGAMSSLQAAETLNAAGALRRAQGRDSEAEQYYRQALGLFREHLGNEDSQVAMVTHNLAVLHHGRGELTKAEAHYREALDITRNTHGEDSPQWPDVCTTWHPSCTHASSGPSAEPLLYRQALDLRRSLLGPDHPQLALNLVDLADVLTAQGKLDEAETLVREGLDLDRRILPEAHPPWLGPWWFWPKSPLRAVTRQRHSLRPPRRCPFGAPPCPPTTGSQRTPRCCSADVFRLRVASPTPNSCFKPATPPSPRTAATITSSPWRHGRRWRRFRGGGSRRFLVLRIDRPNRPPQAGRLLPP